MASAAALKAAGSARSPERMAAIASAPTSRRGKRIPLADRNFNDRPVQGCPPPVARNLPYVATSVIMNSLPVTLDDGHGHNFFQWNVDVEGFANGKNGIVSYAYCRKTGPTLDFAEVTASEENGSVATCKGWWQETGRQTTMTIDWYKTGHTCEPIHWATPNSAAKPSVQK